MSSAPISKVNLPPFSDDDPTLDLFHNLLCLKKSSIFSDKAGYERGLFPELNDQMQGRVERQWAMLDMCGSTRQSRMPLRNREKAQERTFVDRNQVIHLQTKIGNTLRKIEKLVSYLRETKTDAKASAIRETLKNLRQELKVYKREFRLCDPQGYAVRKRRYSK